MNLLSFISGRTVRIVRYGKSRMLTAGSDEVWISKNVTGAIQPQVDELQVATLEDKDDDGNVIGTFNVVCKLGGTVEETF